MVNIQKYEYKVVRSSKFKSEQLKEDELNDLGEIGWELICIDRTDLGSYTYYFKRLKYK